MATAHDQIMLTHAMRALLPRDNPARVATPDHVEVRDLAPRRTFADLSPAERRRTIDRWLGQQQDRYGWVQDQLSIIDVDRLLTSFIAGDDAEIGRMVAHLLLGLSSNVEKDEDFRI